MYKEITLREAKVEDSGLILGFIEKLADYEKLRQDVVNTEAKIRDTLFGPNKVANCLIGELDGIARGFAVYFFNYSTFLGKPGLYIEDLFVDVEFRGQGLGKALFVELVSIAKKRDCGRVEWSVLHWNKPAIDFYLNQGAKPLSDWGLFRLDRHGIERLLEAH